MTLVARTSGRTPSLATLALKRVERGLVLFDEQARRGAALSASKPERARAGEQVGDGEPLEAAEAAGQHARTAPRACDRRSGGWRRRLGATSGRPRHWPAMILICAGRACGAGLARVGRAPAFGLALAQPLPRTGLGGPGRRVGRPARVRRDRVVSAMRARRASARVRVRRCRRALRGGPARRGRSALPRPRLGPLARVRPSLIPSRGAPVGASPSGGRSWPRGAGALAPPVA